MEVVYDDEPWSEVSSCIRTDSMGTGHSSSEKGRHSICE